MTQVGRPPVLDAADAGALQVAARELEHGRVVALPTDTVYGLAARIDRPAALEGIFAAKHRPPDLALPVLVGRWRQVHEVASGWPRAAALVAARFWPGALTVVVPCDPELGARLGGSGKSVGLRQPRHRFVQALCRLAGPLATTSANVHGAPPCTAAAQVRGAFDAATVALVVDGGTCDEPPSTVVDCTVSPPACLREGSIAWSWVEASLR
ncbi:MAG: L-threonylcarbamoyladenylate synthase [Acidimicrobiales bacterium]